MRRAYIPDFNVFKCEVSSKKTAVLTLEPLVDKYYEKCNVGSSVCKV